MPLAEKLAKPFSRLYLSGLGRCQQNRWEALSEPYDFYLTCSYSPAAQPNLPLTETLDEPLAEMVMKTFMES